MEEWRKLLALVPTPPDWKIDWNAWYVSGLHTYFADMEKTGQNPVWHGEGDVWTHTRMVCETQDRKSVV